MLYIGVDLGTSAVKLLLMDETGKIHKIVSKEYPLYFPHPGWSEQRPQDWYEQTIDGIRELTADCEKSRVAGISFGGQMHGLVVLDKEDAVIRPAILWNDGRTAEETDYSDASGMLLLDVKNRCWSKEMLKICGVTQAQLPRLYESYEVVGTLKRELAEELGLPEDVKVVAGAGDNAAAAVGTGTVGDGMCNISLGTSGTIFISSKSFGVDAHNALHSFDHADGYYHLMGCMLSAASCNKWWMDEILKTAEYEKEQASIEKLGENQVFYLPYLMGERSPHNDPAARAAFIGMTMDTTREDMTQAVLEGVAFGLRDSLEVARSLGVNIGRTKICGGGAKSPLWKKIIANVMNLKVDVIESEEGPGYDGAMLAAVGCGEFDSVEEAADKLVKVVDTVVPEAGLVAKYERQYRKFRQIYPALKGVFPALAGE